MLAGNLASIGVGAIVATVTSLIVSSPIKPKVRSNIKFDSGPTTSISRPPVRSTSLLPSSPTTRNLITTAKRRRWKPGRALSLVTLSIVLRRMTSSTLSLSIRPSYSHLGPPSHWYVFALSGSVRI